MTSSLTTVSITILLLPNWLVSFLKSQEYAHCHVIDQSKSQGQARSQCCGKEYFYGGAKASLVNSYLVYLPIQYGFGDFLLAMYTLYILLVYLILCLPEGWNFRSSSHIINLFTPKIHPGRLEIFIYLLLGRKIFTYLYHNLYCCLWW